MLSQSCPIVFPASVSSRGATGRTVTVRRPLGHTTRSSPSLVPLYNVKRGVSNRDVDGGPGMKCPRCGPIYGRMFWFSRKKFVGSYLRLSARSRSYLASP
jgi:hypothetical protein